MDFVFGINTFHSQDAQLENDRKEQFYAECLRLCSLHGAAAALRECSKMWLCHLQAPDEVHEHSGKHCSHELSGDFESTHLDRYPTTPHRLQGATGIACAAGQSQAVQDGETVGESEGGMRLRLHIAEQAELVSAGANLEGAKHLQKESAKALVGTQPAAGQSPAQPHRYHDAGHQQERGPDPTASHGESFTGRRTRRRTSPWSSPGTYGEKESGRGREMTTLPLRGRSQLLSPPACSLRDV